MGAQILEFGEVDCKRALFGKIQIFDVLIRTVLYVKNSFNGTLKHAFNYLSLFQKQKKRHGEMMPNCCPSVDDRDLISAFSIWTIALEVRLLNSWSFLRFCLATLAAYQVPCIWWSVCVVSAPFRWSVVYPVLTILAS